MVMFLKYHFDDKEGLFQLMDNLDWVAHAIAHVPGFKVPQHILHL